MSSSPTVQQDDGVWMPTNRLVSWLTLVIAHGPGGAPMSRWTENFSMYSDINTDQANARRRSASAF